MSLRVYAGDDSLKASEFSTVQDFFLHWYVPNATTTKRRKPTSLATINSRRRPAVNWWTRLMATKKRPFGPLLNEVTDDHLLEFRNKLVDATYRRGKAGQALKLAEKTQVRTVEEIELVLGAAGPPAGRKLRAGFIADPPKIYRDDGVLVLHRAPIDNLSPGQAFPFGDASKRFTIFANSAISENRKIRSCGGSSATALRAAAATRQRSRLAVHRLADSIQRGSQELNTLAASRWDQRNTFATNLAAASLRRDRFDFVPCCSADGFEVVGAFLDVDHRKQLLNSSSGHRDSEFAESFFNLKHGGRLHPSPLCVGRPGATPSISFRARQGRLLDVFVIPALLACCQQLSHIFLNGAPRVGASFFFLKGLKWMPFFKTFRSSAKRWSTPAKRSTH